jgi:hypothetical protein
VHKHDDRYVTRSAAPFSEIGFRAVLLDKCPGMQTNKKCGYRDHRRDTEAIVYYLRHFLDPFE